ncbi:Toll/interleukin-1 receptor domain-containing protein [Tanacetum coccineum]
MQQQAMRQMLQRQDLTNLQSPNVQLQQLYKQHQFLQSLPPAQRAHVLQSLSPAQRAQFVQLQQQLHSRQTIQQQMLQPATAANRSIDSDNLLSSNYSDTDEELVGMTDRAKDMISKLKIGKDGVRMVGIWGVGGSGKTTLATSVYMKIKDHFQGHYRVDNIREESSQSGFKKLQEIFLGEVWKKEVRVPSVDRGKSMIKSRLCHSNVLILLDDVGDSEQLEALAESHSYYPRSDPRRNSALKKILAHSIVDKDACLKIWEFVQLRVVSYAAGLPLAIKVLGSFLYDKDEKEWMSTLDRLKEIPETKIVEKLKISYDGLKTVEKKLFLDIACFFRRRIRNDAMEIFEACSFHPEIGIKVLIQKALITINSNGEFDMHDLIQEMGHFIIRVGSDDFEKDSRVWEDEEINNMCIGDATTENDKIEAMGYYQRPEVVPSHFFKFVSNLRKLRWIHVTTSNDNNVEGPSFLSNELQYINWRKYPASPFPDSFQPMKLVVLKMEDSFQRELWRSYKRLPQLKVLQLKSMKNLVSTPNFDELPCLQKLELYRCWNLEEIHPSTGNHRSLTIVQVYGCDNLRMFPTIFKMEKLELLKIARCHESLEFPDIQANMESLVVLSLYGVGIEEIDFDGLKNLKDLQISGNIQPKMMKIKRFTEKVFPQLAHRLQRLELVYCHLEDGKIPSAIREMSNLQELNLMNNNFSKLDLSISQLTRLKLLNLRLCKRLLELPQLPSSIAIVLADGCQKLTDVGDLYVDGKRLRYASFLGSKVIDGNRLLQSMLQGETAENHCVTLQLQGLEIPKGFTPGLRAGNRKCTLELPENWCSDFCGFLMCTVLINGLEYELSPTITMKQVTTGGSMGMDSEDDVTWKESDGGETTRVWYIPFDSLRHTQWWDSTYKKVSFSIYHITCKGFGVSLVNRKGGNGPTETSAEISTNSSGISDEKDDYTPGFKIVHDSKNYLKIVPRCGF